MNEASLSAKEA